MITVNWDPVRGIEPNTIYYVRVKAIGDEEVYDDSIWSYLSEPVKTLPATPTNLQCAAVTTDSIELTWLAPTNGTDWYEKKNLNACLGDHCAGNADRK